MSLVIDLLQRQHRDVLARIDRDIDHFGDPGIAARFLEFLESDVVAHFRIEEDVLFPELSRNSEIADGPLRVMNAEHAAFRELLAAGKVARDSGVREGVTASARDLAGLLRSHIAKEDHVLFPMALDVLTDDQLSHIDAAFRPA